MEKEVTRISKFFKQKNIDTFVLGCTHYSHIKQYFKNQLDKNVLNVDSSDILARQLCKKIESSNNTTLEILFTGEKPKLKGLFKNFEPFVLSSKQNILPFSQLGIYNSLNSIGLN